MIKTFVFISVLILGLITWPKIIENFVATSEEFKVGMIIAVISIFTAIYQHSKIKEREEKSRLFEKKSNLKDLENKFFDFNYTILVWGSSDTIKAWQKIAEPQKSSYPYDVFLPWAKLYYQMRKDLGHRDNLHPTELIALHLDYEGRIDVKKMKGLSQITHKKCYKGQHEKEQIIPSQAE